jgi:hypothetical protein
LNSNGEIIGGYYSARVKITVKDCIPITDEGVCPVQEGRNARATIDAHDMARKGAITDAMKRAFRCYGNQFGNPLYDKDYGHTPATESKPQQPATTPTRAAVTPSQPRPVDRTAQPAPAPVAAPARPVTQASTPMVVENDANFKTYSAKIHAAKTTRELSDLGLEMKRQVVEEPVLQALRVEYRKAENALVEKANSSVASLVGAGK